MAIHLGLSSLNVYVAPIHGCTCFFLLVEVVKEDANLVVSLLNQHVQSLYLSLLLLIITLVSTCSAGSFTFGIFNCSLLHA